MAVLPLLTILAMSIAQPYQNIACIWISIHPVSMVSYCCLEIILLKLSALPSRVLSDAFHIIDMMDVPLRHGLSKDFKRRFRDAMFIIDAEDRKNVEEYLIKNGNDWNTCMMGE
jgi:hypothetical protein